MRSLVSILIPAFNAEKWLRDTILSALDQTWEPKEIIIVDDGSTDRTLQIARQFQSDSVRVVTQKNQGASAARNKALSLSRGAYIQWLDADDLMAPDKIARQMEVLMQAGSRRTLASCAFGTFMYRPHRAHFTPTALWHDLSPAEFLMRKLETRRFMVNSAWLVSRELTAAAGPWDVRLHYDDDGEYFCRVLLASDGIRFLPEARVYYRSVGPTSVSYMGTSNTKLESLWLSMQLHMQYLRSLEDSQRTRASCIRYLQNYLIDFYPRRLDIVEKMDQTARNLGGQLERPRLSWKYAWMKALLGWGWTKRAQLVLRKVKWSLIRYCDRALFHLENRSATGVHDWR
jgi:glycosyltransferase involved in cell wall biosynthesis